MAGGVPERYHRQLPGGHDPGHGMFRVGCTFRPAGRSQEAEECDRRSQRVERNE